jgi:hypothetical protein
VGVLSIVDVARELVSWVNPETGRLLVLACYFDDSGTHAGSPVVVFGDLLGEKEHWQEFEPKWRAKLAAPLPGKPPLKRFHMFDCEWGLGEFADYNKAERDAVTHDFRQIILDSGVTGVCAGIARPDFDELITGALRASLGSADDMAFASALSALDDIKHIGLSLIFDNTGTAPTARYSALYDRYQKMFAARGEPLLQGLAFRSMTDALPLQGADMIAWETYFHMVDVLKAPGAKPRVHLQRYLDTDRFFAVLMTRARMLEYLGKVRSRSGATWGWWDAWSPS